MSEWQPFVSVNGDGTSEWYLLSDDGEIVNFARLIMALKGNGAWLERWAVHVGSCAGGNYCTCGLTLAIYENKAAISLLQEGDALAERDKRIREDQTEMTEWQPIETAPKDGTRILVWVNGDWTFAWYCEETGLWPHDYAWSEEFEPCNVGLPSHWMPPPAPPQERDDE